MVRTYVRKTEKGAGFQYTYEDIQRAIDDIKNGNRTTRGAALFYHIPRSTLKHYVLGTRGKGSTSKDGRGGGGVISYLSSTEEAEIANCVRVMERNGFGLSREDILDVVQTYIRQNNLQTRFKNQRPGKDWFISFKKRHRLSNKKPQSVEYIRRDQVNPWVIYDFFDKLTGIITELKIEDKPGQIYNCDETSFCHDPSKTKIVGAIGASCQRQTSSTGRENTSVLLCCSAVGKTLPLLCVFKGKYVMDNWINEKEFTQTAVAVTERGWMETTLFYNWFRDVFLKNIGEERPVLLVYDGHVTHISTKLIQLAQENNVTIMKLPPHTTHVLQPLDVAVFKGLKTKWDKELCKWQRHNPRKKIPKAEFTSILTRIVGEIPETNIVNGFKATGIYDLGKRGPNREAIPLSIFKPEDLKRYISNNNQPLTLNSETASISSNLTLETLNGTTTEEQQINMPSTSRSLPIPQNEQFSPKTSKDGLCEPENTENHENQLINTSKSSALENTYYINEQPSTSKSALDTPKRSFEDLLLEMLKKDTKIIPERKRRRLVNNCEIITSTEYLEKRQREEDQNKQKLLKKNQNLQKKKKEKNKTEKKQENHSSSNDDSDYSLHESDDSVNLRFSDTEEEVNSTILHAGDYAVIKVFGKDDTSFRLYIAKIEEADNEGYEVKFLKRHSQTMKFIYTDEQSYIKKSEVVQKLSQPLTSKSARYANMVYFANDLTDLSNLIS